MTLIFGAATGLAICVTLAWIWIAKSRAIAASDFSAQYTPLSPPEKPLRVYHLGHSLVGRDMPAMVAQLADGVMAKGYQYESQLGWGTSLKQHWEPDEPINGFENENDHARFRPAKEALETGTYDAFVLTEMVEIKDAIKYHDSGKYFPIWVAHARAANPKIHIYLYETWHSLDDKAGWLKRLDNDLPRYWERELMQKVRLAEGVPPVYLIPAGQVMARFARALQETEGVEGIRTIEDLFLRQDDGSLDTIHLNDMGHYLIALTHFSVLYHQSPLGLPRELRKADGTAASAPSEEAATLMQSVVWDVVTSTPKTGVAP